MLNSSIIVNQNVSPAIPMWNHVYANLDRAITEVTKLGQGFDLQPVTDFLTMKPSKKGLIVD